MKCAPIVLFAYNRPEHTIKTIEALTKNELAKESDFFVFSDGHKDEGDEEKVREVRRYLKKVIGFKNIEIRESQNNIGLANSIIAGVTEIVNRYGKIIVMEDDLVSSPYFLKFMNEALELYQNEERVISIHGYLYPIAQLVQHTFFLQHASSWGWATWKRGWDLFEKDGQKLLNELEKKNLLKKFDLNGAYNFTGMLKRQIGGLTDSWAIRWNASSLANNKLNLYPGASLIQNIGQDGTGSHRGNSDRHKVVLSTIPIDVRKIALEESPDAAEKLENLFKSFKPSLHARIVRKIKDIL
jgi:hypothetical protein